jgi:hypothetical protein
VGSSVGGVASLVPLFGTSTKWQQIRGKWGDYLEKKGGSVFGYMWEAMVFIWVWIDN